MKQSEEGQGEVPSGSEHFEEGCSMRSLEHRMLPVWSHLIYTLIQSVHSVHHLRLEIQFRE